MAMKVAPLLGKGAWGSSGRGGGFATVPFSDSLHAREEFQPVDLFSLLLYHSFVQKLFIEHLLYTRVWDSLCRFKHGRFSTEG